MPNKKQPTTPEPQPSVESVSMPSVERIQQELGSAKSLDDFFGKEGIFARLFADTVEQMLEAELTAHLGYPPLAPEGRNSGNSRNGKRSRKLRTSSGDTTIQVPRDRKRLLALCLVSLYAYSLRSVVVAAPRSLSPPSLLIRRQLKCAAE
jgi:transposase-like protein